MPKIYEPRVKIEDAIKEIQSNAFYFIKHRDRTVGSASFRLQDDGSAYIGNMAVDPIYRRQGVGRHSARGTCALTLNARGTLARASWPDLVALSIAVGAFVYFGARYLQMLTESTRAHP